VIENTRRTPLVASGFIFGALIGALPPVQMLCASWQCASSGGRYDAELRVCDLRDGSRTLPPDSPQRTLPFKLLHEYDP
jgi:hypothetical protein